MTPLPRLILTLVALIFLSGCGSDAVPRSGVGELTLRSDPLPEGAEGWSFLGGALFPPPLAQPVMSQRSLDLAEAETTLAETPDDPEAWIWVGRREAYLGQYRGAIQTFSEGLDRFPDDVRFLRHRGHRWITLREFGLARTDLTRGIEALDANQGREIEPDGMPNAAGIPLTTLAFNLWYHRALAEYLAGDFAAARGSWQATLEVSENPDLDVAARFWFYLTLRRLGDDEGAFEVANAVDAEAPLLENGTYRDLLLHATGQRTADEILPPRAEGLASVTALHGLGIEALLRGDDVEARRLFQTILDRPDQWPAFGYIAAEVEVARRGW